MGSIDINYGYLLAALLGFLIGTFVAAKKQAAQKRRNKAWYERRRKDEEITVDTVAQGSYALKNLLNYKEIDLYWILVNLLGKSKKYIICPQASLGEALSSPDNKSFRAINSKRCDILILNNKFRPLAGIEYQGHGHEQGSWQERDQMKKLALEKSGMAYIEIFPHQSKENLKRHVQEQLERYGLLPLPTDT